MSNKKLIHIDQVLLGSRFIFAPVRNTVDGLSSWGSSVVTLILSLVSYDRSHCSSKMVVVFDGIFKNLFSFTA